MPFASTEELILAYVDENQWMLVQDLVYFDSKFTNLPIKVPAGFITDGSSIPQPLWGFVGHPLQGGYVWAGLVHDLLYREHMFTRKICDAIFKEACLELGMPKWKAQGAYIALRSFGWISWNAKEKR